MQKELNVNVTAKDGEITIREGKALEQYHPAPVELKGTLEAPFQYFKGKSPEAADSHILIFKDKGGIHLVLNDRSVMSKVLVIGTLTKDTILHDFYINSEQKWTVVEFLKFIKTMRFYFADKGAHAKLVQSLQKWSVKVERVINEHNDQRGNSNFQLETKVQQSAIGDDGLISKFDLNIPIFQGYAKHKFTVEIGLDPNNTTVKLFLISDELIELEIGQREKLIQDEIDKFADFPCSKVVIS